MRKTILVLSIIFAFGLVAAGYYLQNSVRIKVVDPFLAIPGDAAIMFETENFQDLLAIANDRSSIIKRLGKMRWASEISGEAGVVDSIIRGEEPGEFISGKKVIVSFHPGSSGRLIPLLAISTGPGISRHKISSLLMSTGAKVTEEREEGGTRIFAATYGQGAVKKIYFASAGGVLIITPSESIMSNALNNEKNGNDIRLQQGFSKVASAFESGKNNLFIIFRNLQGFLTESLNPSAANDICSVAVAAGGEIDSKEGGIYINGFVSSFETGAGIDKITTSSPETPGVQEVLPESAISFTTTMRELSLSGDSASDPSGINATDIALSLRKYIDKEVTTAKIQTKAGQKQVILFRVNNRTEAEEVLVNKISAKHRSMGLKGNDYLINTESSNGDKVLLYRMPFQGIASLLSGGKRLEFSDTYVMFCRAYLIFADDPEALSEIYNASVSEKTLMYSPVFREVEKSLPTKSSFLCYGSAEAMAEMVKNITDPYKAGSSFDPESFSELGAMGLSLSPSNGMVYATLSVAYRKEGDDDIQSSAADTMRTSADTMAVTRLPGETLLWKASLKTPPVIKPFIFINHNNNSKEIFVQDASNIIYLINASGKVLWKAQIREKIKGDVYMIDCYNNSKNQILFAGKDYLHLIDRNGKYVDRFPVRLKSPASSGLSVFDYDSNKDYRIFIAGEDKKIYAYDKKGDLIKGWVPFNTSALVSSPMLYFRSGGRDYLIIHDSRRLYILDRKGNVRVNIKQPLNVAENSTIQLSEEGRLVFADQNGRVHNLKFSGEDESGFTQECSPGFFFDFNETEGKEQKEYVFIDKGELTILKEDYSRVADLKLPVENFSFPESFISSSGNYLISLVDNVKGQVWLIDGKGKIVSGFPVRGSVMPVSVKLSKASGNTLITGGPDNNIYCYKISK